MFSRHEAGPPLSLHPLADGVYLSAGLSLLAAKGHDVGSMRDHGATRAVDAYAVPSATVVPASLFSPVVLGGFLIEVGFMCLTAAIIKI